MKVEARKFGNNVPIKPIEEPELILPFEFQWDIGYLDQPEDSEYRMKIPARLYYGHHVRLHPEDEPELLKDGEKNIKALKGLRILAEQGREFRMRNNTFHRNIFKNRLEALGFGEPIL